VYFVFSGRLQFKLEDEVVEVGPGTAVRVPAGTARSVWNDRPEDAHLLIMSRRDDPPDDAIIVEDFWPD
jgi:mannose-6-phosphate isomerase-like protein (cupin superfamily)